jgi:hypothetical protein
MLQNNRDFRYEYSDLNLFQTRVELLTGAYAGTILEYGSSRFEQSPSHHDFYFDYEIYHRPEGINTAADEFVEYIGRTILAVLAARAVDPEEFDLHQQAASARGKQGSAITIDEAYYYQPDPGAEPRVKQQHGVVAMDPRS